MSDTQLTLALTTLAQNYAGDIKRQINRRAALFSVLPKVQGAGKNVAWVAESDGAVVDAAFFDGAAAANFGSDSQTPATLAWGLYRSNFHVTDLALAAAATSGTPAGNIQLWARNLVNASGALAAEINGALFDGVGTGTNIAGLGVAIGSTSNTYAGIDRSSATYWRPTNSGSSKSTLTKAQIVDDLAQIYIAGGVRPNLAVCNPLVFAKVEALFETQRRFVQDAMVVSDVVLGEVGIPMISVNGTMFLEDKDGYADTGAGIGNIYYLNTDNVRIEYLPAPMAPVGFTDEAIAAWDGFQQISAGMSYTPLARVGAAKRASVVSQLQLVVDKPNTCGVRRFVDLA